MTNSTLEQLKEVVQDLYEIMVQVHDYQLDATPEAMRNKMYV